MAEVKAIASGPWSGGLATFDAIPASGDTVRANGFTVTIDVDVNIGNGTIATAVGGTAVAGGGFVITTNRTCTFNILAGTTSCLSITGSGLTVTVNGNTTGSATTTSRFGINLTASASTLYINGNCIGNNANDSYGATQNAAGSFVYITGDLTGGVGSAAAGFLMQIGISYIVGNVYGAPVGAGVGLHLNSPSVVSYVTGNITAQAGAGSSIAGDLILTGNIYGSATNNVVGININSVGTGTVINGNVVAGIGGGSANGILLVGTNRFVVNGSAIASSVAHGINVTGSLIAGAHVERAIGNNFTLAQTYGLSNANTVNYITINHNEMGANGTNGFIGMVKFKAGEPRTVKIRLSDDTYETFSSGVDDLPLESDVRAGVQYQFGTKEGTCEVPAPESVGFGVPVDATTGVAIFDLENWLDAMALSNNDLAVRLRNVSTVQTNGSQLEAAL